MSDNSALISPLRRLEPNDISILRYVAGSALAMAIAMGGAWNLSFLLPVLSLGYFAPGAKPPTFKQGAFFILTIVVSSLLVLLFTKLFLDYLLVFIPLFALALLHVFYTNRLAITNKLFVLMTLMLIPMLGFISLEVALLVAKGIIIGAVLTIFLVWMVYAIIPNIANSEIVKESKQMQKPMASEERFLNALNTLIVVLPVVLVFYFFQWSGAILIMIFIAILSMQPAFNIKAGVALILGNLLGGVAAILMYEMLVVVPEFFFLILMVLFAGLYFGVRVHTGKKTAPLYGMAYSTILLILGQSTSGTDDAGEKVWIRVFQIMIAVIYVVLAFSVLNFYKQRYLARKERRKTLAI
jgi:hypothetical protein